jgi:hypothetical protein
MWYIHATCNCATFTGVILRQWRKPHAAGVVQVIRPFSHARRHGA